MNQVRIAFSGIIIALFSACMGGGGEGTLTGNISIDGSSTVYPVTEAVAEEYRTEQPRVRVTVGLSGTGGGFKKFGRNEIDLCNASRSIKPEEAEICRENNIQYIELAIAYDGLAVVAHPKNDWLNEITVEELKRIWEPAAQGVIKRWNQVRPEWPDAPLHLYGAGVESGTFDYFTEAIVGRSHESRGDYTASEDDNILVQGIAGDINALGFMGLAYYEENHEMLKLVPVDEGKGKGPAIPTRETVKNKIYTPLSRPLFIYVNSEAAKRGEVQDFITFYLTYGGLLAEEVGYIALTDDEYEDELDKFKKFVEGL